ncbi:AB hydrolase-1 domain-containing protein [Balamuthia mandrillaris]
MFGSTEASLVVGRGWWLRRWWMQHNKAVLAVLAVVCVALFYVVSTGQQAQEQGALWPSAGQQEGKGGEETLTAGGSQQRHGRDEYFAVPGTDSIMHVLYGGEEGEEAYVLIYSISVVIVCFPSCPFLLSFLASFILSFFLACRFVSCLVLSFLLSLPTHSRWLLIHGADKNHQNALHWKPHLPFFEGLGRYYAFDLLGHGQSQPGPTANPRPTLKERLEALRQFIIQKRLAPTEEEEAAAAIKFNIVARSYGGRLAIELLREFSANIKRLILIAPAIKPSDVAELEKELTDVPVLLLWATEDTVAPYRYAELLMDSFNANMASQLVTFERVVTDVDALPLAHVPELQRVQQFQDAVTEFVHSTKE